MYCVYIYIYIVVMVCLTILGTLRPSTSLWCVAVMCKLLGYGHHRSELNREDWGCWMLLADML